MNEKIINSYQILDHLRLPHGLYLASSSNDYHYVWLRDSFYMSLPFLEQNNGIYEMTYHRILDLFKEYEWKLDIHTRQNRKSNGNISIQDIWPMMSKKWICLGDMPSMTRLAQFFGELGWGKGWKKNYP
ncbi:hypothetical protein NDK43_32565 [Neobacillus pocheonensis]|uniref:Uncharacterized protein n=1 Tax=Neobacillus pocheonensis TaxID=363869 RepID=A0ABT0WIK7_9BACI|nr:hypothetical protein [Neobacillus pocheonensis]